MKKILVLMMIAATVLTACGKKKDNTENSQVSQNTTSTEYKVDFKKACSDEAINEIVKYFASTQPDTPTDELKAELTLMANYIKTVNKLKLDYEENYISVLNANGGDAGIEAAKADGIPESYINFVLSANASVPTVYEYMKENDLLLDGKEYFLENYWRAKHVLISTDGKTDEEKAEAKKKAEDVLARARAGEDFSKMVEELSEDPGSKSQPDGYVFTTGEMVEEFENGTKNTNIGEFTMVETSYGYHVIQRLAIDETPELYEKFYEQSNVAAIVNEDTIADFVNKTAAE